MSLMCDVVPGLDDGLLGKTTLALLDLAQHELKSIDETCVHFTQYLISLAATCAPLKA